MVKPSSRAGQRRNAIGWRTIRGRLGSISAESAAKAAIPAVAATRINFRLFVGRKANLLRTLNFQDSGYESLTLQNNLKAKVRDSGAGHGSPWRSEMKSYKPQSTRRITMGWCSRFLRPPFLHGPADQH